MLKSRGTRPAGSRLSVRPRCRAWTNHRVGAGRWSGGRVVRHDRSTPPTTPTVCLALPAPHALFPACSVLCPCTRCVGPSDLSFSSAHGPCTPVHAVRLLNPMAGLIHRPFRPGGRGGEQSGARATSSSRRPLWAAAHAALASEAALALRLSPAPISGQDALVLVENDSPAVGCVGRR